MGVDLLDTHGLWKFRVRSHRNEWIFAPNLMEDAAVVFILLGAMFLLGLAADGIGRRTLLPRVTMVLIIGFAVGPECFGFLPDGYEALFQRSAEIALTMVGFLLGERLVHSVRGGEGRTVLLISVAVVCITALVVLVGLWAIGVPLPAALLLAGIATATDPAATIDVVRQIGAKGKFASTLLGVVAVDDAWGLLGFSLLMAVAGVVVGDGTNVWEPIGEGAWEVGGALLIGGGLGLIMAYLTGRISKGEPTMLEAIGFVFLACGLSIAAGVSFILTAMVMGVCVALFAKHHQYPFAAIEHIELPFMILFFVLAGASLEIAALGGIGLAGAAYVGLRMFGRSLGGWAGGRFAGAPPAMCRGMGLGLMPQAGVALGMALLAKQKFPEQGELVLQIAIGSTVFFELVGPLMTRYAVGRAQRLEDDAARREV
jgi:Kef-type K+ transport system membrane component KefB